MSAAYVGFQGLEDDFCRRVLARVSFWGSRAKQALHCQHTRDEVGGHTEFPKADAGWGKLRACEDEEESISRKEQVAGLQASPVMT